MGGYEWNFLAHACARSPNYQRLAANNREAEKLARDFERELRRHQERAAAAAVREVPERAGVDTPGRPDAEERDQRDLELPGDQAAQGHHDLLEAERHLIFCIPKNNFKILQSSNYKIRSQI